MLVAYKDYFCAMSIKVKNITKLYGKQKALDNVSFEVASGNVVGFLGPNGAGKSTMMKIITCFLPQTSGTAEVVGYDVNDNSVEVRRQVGYLPEHNPLYLDMYVKEFLHFVGGVYQIQNLNTRVKEMIDLTGLSIEQNKKIGALSKGFRQRVGIAQALIHNPKVLVMDEPTSGLDPNQLSEIRMLIKNIGKEKTVILSTHIMQEVEAICDRVIIINKGKIVADASTKILQKQSANSNSVIIEFDQPVALQLLSKISGVAAIDKLDANRFRFTAENDIRPQLFNFAVEQNLTIITLQKEERSLEYIFHELTQNAK